MNSQVSRTPKVKQKPKLAKKLQPPQYRFGIGEWYGKSFVALSLKERKYYASIQSQSKPERPPQPCPFLSRPGDVVPCWKPGGICSLRSYEKSRVTGLVTIDSRQSTLRATCPSRFEQERSVYRWIGESILSDPDAVPIGETPFLKRVSPMGRGAAISHREVGRIDNVLVIPGSDPIQWCPVEKQAVYFSGEKMSLEFQNILNCKGEGIPFPVRNRRPDYRSSGPKRLLPQLEIKVPTLSTWGKKMAVVVDEDFFDRLGQMKETNDISNAEVVWFVVAYAESQSGFKLQPLKVFITRLKDAIDGLVAAVPVPQKEFELAIRTRLAKVKTCS